MAIPKRFQNLRVTATQIKILRAILVGKDDGASVVVCERVLAGAQDNRPDECKAAIKSAEKRLCRKITKEEKETLDILLQGREDFGGERAMVAAWADSWKEAIDT